MLKQSDSSAMNSMSSLSLLLLVFATIATDEVEATKKFLDEAKSIAEAKITQSTTSSAYPA